MNATKRVGWFCTRMTFRELGNNQTEMTVTKYAEFGTISNFAQIGLDQSVEKIVAIFS